MDERLNTFFNPKGIIFVGASSDPKKLGYGLARNLVNYGYHGNINFVNPKGGELLGYKLYKAIADVKDISDLAILLIPAKFVLEALAQCKEKNIKSVIISSGGFREVGDEGRELEIEIAKFGKDNDIRILGPNCIGILDSNLPLNTTFLQESAKIKGKIAFVSHSGAICAAILDWASSNEFGFSKMMSLGNQVDVNETEMLSILSKDDATKVITMYLEGVSGGKDFVKKASMVSKSKPIIVQKVGRSESGIKAVASHTGALAGQDIAFNAAFRRAGILRADTTEEMFEWANVLANCFFPKGDKIAILTNAGGPGVTAADVIDKYGLDLARLSQETQEQLSELLPPSASISNPIDILASGSPEQYSKSLSLLLKDPDVDMVMIILPPPPMFSSLDIVTDLIPIIKGNKEKPVVVVLMGGELAASSKSLLRNEKIPEFEFPEEAASSLGALYKYSNSLKAGHDINSKSYFGSKEKVENILQACEGNQNEFLDNHVVEKIMEAYNIPLLKMELATTEKEATDIATRIGFPIVLKIASPEISHKSDVGGVLLNIKNNNELLEGFKKLSNIGRDKKKLTNGVYVQKMFNGSHEVIVGALQDSQFGGMVMFGSGGTDVEGLKDVAFSLAPVSNEDIAYMFKYTWAGKKLDGFRNIPPGDKNSVKNVLTKLGDLVSDFPELSEIEINPLLVLPDNQGVVALDIRIKC